MLITNISKIIDDILSQNKLIPEVGTDEFFSIAKNRLKRFYVTPCRTEDEKKIFFKVLINDNPQDRETITSEIKLYQYFSNQNFRSFRTPRIYASGLEPIVWYNREYIKYGTIADMHFILEKFIEKIETYSQMAAEALIEMSCFLPDKKSDIGPEPNSYFVNRISEYDTYISKYLPNFKKDSIRKYKKTLTSFSGDKILVHGDYHLENLFFKDSGLVIADWERVHTGNVAEDFSSLWVSLWQVPKNQAEIFTIFYLKLSEDKRKSFDKDIESMLLVQAAKEFQHWIYCKDIHRNPRYSIEIVNQGFNYFFQLLTSLLDGSFKLNEVK